MNKCQHGQKITLFCATDNCQFKEGAGCETCIKKYHNHLAHTVHLNEEQVNNLIKKFTLDNAVKPKCRLLQESIYNYFNQIKTEISNALDGTCKNIINQIGYPYLSTTNALSIYKRLKNKQYRKITQKQFKTFYEIANKINQKELTKEENKIYLAEIKSSLDIISLLENIAKGFQSAIKNYNTNFIHQANSFQKIGEIVRSIGNESPVKNFKKTSESKDRDIDAKYNRDPPKFNLINSPLTNNEFTTINTKFQLKSFDTRIAELKIKGIDKTQPDNEPFLPSPSAVLPSKTLKSRDVSLDKKMVKEHKFNDLLQQEEKAKQNQKSQAGLPNQKIQTLKQELNYREMEINQKKKLLIGIMKQNDRNQRLFQKLESIQLSPIKPRMAEILRKQQLTIQTRSANESKSSRSSEDLTALEDQTAKMQQNIKNYAFAKLPIVEDIFPKKPQQKKQIKKKLFIVPTQLNTKGANNKINELDSPLYKKRRIQSNFEQAKYKDQSRQKSESLYKKVENELRIVNKEVLQIKQNEQKSLALLLKSLHLSAQDAVVYLQSSLKYADNNLSAAEYLSYLYLELNRPKDCLNLCNKFLDRMQNSNEPEEVSININNNRAAALNIIGRYSQAILAIERCLKFKEKDSLYKNLGDSYFSIGNNEKAIFNYQKSIKLNSNNDESHYNLAVCLYHQQNFQNSKLSIKKALELNPKHEQYQQLQSFIDLKIKLL